MNKIEINVIIEINSLLNLKIYKNAIKILAIFYSW